MIDSILENDYQDWELLAIDDGSTQETWEYLKHYEEDSRIHLIKRIYEPKGAPTCRNIGLEMAKGEYLVFFDSDDYAAPYCLSQRVKQIDNHPELDFMVFPSGTFNGGVFRTKNKYDIYGYPIYKDDLTAFYKRTLPFIVWNNIYRTSSLRKKQIVWDTNLLSLQDSDFNIQALLKGLSYEYATAQPDYGYRTETNSSSVSKKIASEKHRQSHIYFINKQYEQAQRVYKTKYNSTLYQGTLFLFSTIFAEGMELATAKQMADIVSHYDSWHGFMLRSKVTATSLLEKIFPKKFSRQIVMPLFLIRKIMMERVIIPRRIANKQHSSDTPSV